MAPKKKIKDVQRPKPTNVKSPFRYDELFFSVTDPKSHITFANEVFVRVSRYPEEEVIGQLHKLIRHPDMPRAVFKIFWDRLKANKPVAAYVKNLAKDGSYYWVMALAFPCEGGYLSIRLKPGGSFFEKIKTYYAETLSVEQRQEKKAGKRKAMNLSEAHLLDLLQEEGFESYEEFMWNALQIEMNHRQKLIDKKQQEHSEIPGSLLELEPTLRKLVSSLEQLKKIHEGLVTHSDYILKLARSILFLSMNAQIGSAKLDQDDVALSVIAENMGSQSMRGEQSLIGMKENIHGLSELIGKLNFDIVSASLQVEMTIRFLNEINDGIYNEQHADVSPNTIIALLYDAFTPRLDTIAEGLGELPVYLQDLLGDIKKIERFLLTLRLIHTSGKIEVARLDGEAGSFANTFQELVEEIETAQGHLDELSDLVTKHKATGEMCTEMQKKINDLVQQLSREAA